MGVASAGTGYRTEVVNEGPAGYWRLGESSGTTAAAEVGGVNGSYIGGTMLARPGAITADPDTAVGLDGADDRVNFGDPANGLFDVGAGDFSVEVWIKTSLNAERTIVGKRASSGNHWYLTVTDDSGRVGRVRSTVNVGSLQYSYSTVRVDDGAWHYVVAVFDRDSGVQFYVDGAAAGFTAHTFTSSLNNSGPLRLGKVTGVSSFSGNEDEFALYKKLMTAQDVTDHWNAAILGGTSAQCADGLDNDGDTKIDYPADPGCSSGSDNDETDLPPPLAGCSRWVATNGSNSNPGTSGQPWLTVQYALNTLVAGQTACVRSGTYTENLTYNRALAGFIEIKSEVQHGAILRSASATYTLRVNSEGSFLRVRGFLFNYAPIGSGGCVDLYGNDIQILENEITSCGDQGIYTEEGSDRILIARNRIHHVGGMRTRPGQSNGIYLQGTDHTVESNLLWDNRFGFGIQVYDFDVRPRILNNTVVNSAHGGIVLGGTTGAVVVGNIVYDNDTYGIDRSSTPANSGCSIHDNLAFANGTNYNTGWPSGCFGSDNAVANPLFANYPARNLRLANGSPGIDTSDPAFRPLAVDGVTRPQGAGPDKGAYER